jgi:Plasmid encoded RepA protein
MSKDAPGQTELAEGATILTITSTRARRLGRLLDHGDATDSDPESILYQHTVFCQTGLPYRNPGDAVLTWERLNGGVHLEIAAGKVMHPERERLVQVGLPYGPKPRLILAHLNAEAIRKQSPEIEVNDSLTAFVKALNLDPKGRNIAAIKDQLGRLSASHITLGIVRGGEAITINSQIVTAFNMWFPKQEDQRVLWPSTVRLSADYFDGLIRHAVPLHNHALMALSGSAMGLDMYAWLAQRLHRIERGKPVFIPWMALRAQFGWHYDRMDKFKAVFRHTLKLVLSQYRTADIELDGRGMTLWNSPPPVKGRTGIVVKAP